MSIHQAIIRYNNHPYNYTMPNIFLGSYEMDVACLNRKSRYLTEYEVKVSRSDFKADFTKGIAYWDGERKILRKHDNFRDKTRITQFTPNRFVFVVPKDLIAVSEIPDYAGLMYYNEESDSVSYVKTGRIIHKTPASDKVMTAILDKAYWKYKYNSHEVARLYSRVREFEKKEYEEYKKRSENIILTT